jgi:hypothetical protein
MVNCIVTRKLPIWADGGWSIPQPTRSIAWAFADAARAEYGAELPDTRIDLGGLSDLDAVWENRGDHFDGVFDTSMTVWEALKLVSASMELTRQKASRFVKQRKDHGFVESLLLTPLPEKLITKQWSVTI